MSTTSTEHAKPAVNINQECNKCKMAGSPNIKIGFEKLGTDPATGKNKWKLWEEDPGSQLGMKEHQHRGNQNRGGGGAAQAEATKELAAAVRDVAAAIRESFGK